MPASTFLPFGASSLHTLATAIPGRRIALLFLPLASLAAQPAPGPAFEAATIRVDTSAAPESGEYQNGRFTVRNAPLRDLIVSAWQTKSDLVQGGPDWIRTARFDVSAKAGPAASESASRLMLRTLLAERFRLKVHYEERPLPVYLLQAARNGARLPPPDPDSPLRTGCFSSEPILCHNVTLATVAGALRSNGTGIDVPVLDETGIAGRFDLKLEYVLDKPSAAAPAGGPSIFDALHRYGLELRSAKRPMQVLVIDHVEPLLPEN